MNTYYLSIYLPTYLPTCILAALGADSRLFVQNPGLQQELNLGHARVSYSNFCKKSKYFSIKDL